MCAVAYSNDYFFGNNMSDLEDYVCSVFDGIVLFLISSRNNYCTARGKTL